MLKFKMLATRYDSWLYFMKSTSSSKRNIEHYACQLSELLLL